MEGALDPGILHPTMLLNSSISDGLHTAVHNPNRSKVFSVLELNLIKYVEALGCCLMHELDIQHCTNGAIHISVKICFILGDFNV